MRILAFDYGTKRIGIAATDPAQIIATALTTIHPNESISFLKNYLEQEPVSTFVVGQPKQMDGTPSQSAPHVKGFIRQLKKEFPTVKLIEVDERFTSKLALQAISQSGLKKNKRQDKGLVDQVSAVLLLQSYLETQT